MPNEKSFANVKIRDLLRILKVLKERDLEKSYQRGEGY